MRTGTIAAIALLLGFAMVAAAVPAQVSAGGRIGHGDDVVYLALGDSVAVGTGAQNEARLGYVGRVYRFARIASLGRINRLENLAVGGETSATYIAGGQMAAALATIEDPDSDTRLVTIDIGGDDLLPLLKQEPCASNPTSAECQSVVAQRLEIFGSNLPTILGSLQAALAGDPGTERLMIMTYYNPFSGTGSPFEAPVDGVLLGSDGTVDCAANATDSTKVGLNDIITCVGTGAGATVVDVYPAFQGRGALLTHIAEGDIHPNDLGHFVIALQFARAAFD